MTRCLGWFRKSEREDASAPMDTRSSVASGGGYVLANVAMRNRASGLAIGVFCAGSAATRTVEFADAFLDLLFIGGFLIFASP